MYSPTNLMHRRRSEKVGRMTLNGRRYLSRLAVNFTTGLAFSRPRSRLSRDFRGDSGLAFFATFLQFLHFCYVFAFLSFFANIFHIKESLGPTENSIKNEGVEEGYPLKRRHFAVIGSNNVKTVADRYIHAAYHNKHW